MNRKQLREGLEEGNDTAIRELFVRYGKDCISFLQRYSKDCSPQLAEDLMMDGMLTLIAKARKGDLPPLRNLRNYLFTICKNLLLKHLERQKNTLSYKKEEKEIYAAYLRSYPQNLKPAVEPGSWDLVKKGIASLGSKCQDILQMFYFEKLSMKTIASRLNYTDAKVAKSSKARCLAQLKKLIAIAQKNES